MKFKFMAGKTQHLLVESAGDNLVGGAALDPIGGIIVSNANEHAEAFKLRMTGGGP